VKLRTGVKFHDAKELTADDVVFTYRIPLKKENNGERGSGLESLESVTKKGDYQVEFKLKKKEAYFYNVVLDSYGILPKH
ncbi:ABC transporter substrate-binding protein, partial [Bacillus vallismortis]|nr:ABC transporter substrate-binding protein [Bacillus vallismortis]